MRQGNPIFRREEASRKRDRPIACHFVCRYADPERKFNYFLVKILTRIDFFR